MHPIQELCKETGLTCFEYIGKEESHCLGIYSDECINKLKRYLKQAALKHTQSLFVASALANSAYHVWGEGFVLLFPGISFYKG